MSIASAVNDDEILGRTLARSPDLSADGTKFLALYDAESASGAYNRVLDDAVSDLVVFVHQDVYLPRGWIATVLKAAARLDMDDPRWAVLGVYGVAASGAHVGKVWSGDQQIELVGGGGVDGEVASLDEVVLILRTDAGLRFDGMLPHFHLYGTDIVQTALSAGRSAYVIAAPVIHDTTPVASLGGGFAAGYRYLQTKWADRLPITTPMTTITRSGLPFLRARLRHRWHARRRQLSGVVTRRHGDVVALARAIGYEPA